MANAGNHSDHFDNDNDMLSLKVAVPIFTIFWVLFGAVLPWFIPKGPNRGIIQTMIVTTAICCYSLWLIVFLAQINPLVAPNVKTEIVGHIRKQWKLSEPDGKCPQKW
ncbi:V-type proton ATPase subunit e 2-like [Dysidea avara]|uniref:V-type proton ATPase subunit e 2-like n=1 Tax=Dysidea avara TaxID=196820 RepID=UPI00332C647A